MNQTEVASASIVDLRLFDLQIEMVIFGTDTKNLSRTPFYTTSINLSRTVCHRMTERGYVWRIACLTAKVGYECYQAVFYKVDNPDLSFMAEDATESLAIGRAAVGVAVLERELTAQQETSLVEVVA